MHCMFSTLVESVYRIKLLNLLIILAVDLLWIVLVMRVYLQQKCTHTRTDTKFRYVVSSGSLLLLLTFNRPLQTGSSLVQNPLLHSFVLDPIIV